MTLKFDPRTRKEKTTYIIFWALWIIANYYCWQWWFKPEHIGNNNLFLTISVALIYESSILPTFYLFFLGKIRKPVTDKNLGKDLKVAMITLCVPSKESLEIIREQLEAMVKVRYPHDSWVLDEESNPEVRKIALRLGIRYFSRKGVEKYNQDKPPFQKKTKAGNVNAWLNWVTQNGFHYDFFTQLDIDHRPNSDYLEKVLGFFKDPKVAWVQAPSVYNNFDKSWCAKGATEQELVLQGPLQMGFFGFTETPFIIGSHTTYRTSSIIEINGFQPTRAEDHLDTVVLASKGYKGIFIPEVIAEGKGPENFQTYTAQQFAWAYSMMQVLFYYMPKLITKYKPKQAIQFLFAQTWYTFWSTAMAILFSLPAISILINKPIGYMGFIEALVHFTPLPTTSFLFWWWSKRWFQPKNINLSWRGILLHIARWPIVFWALVNVLFEVKRPYMITSKGKDMGEKRKINITTILPYVLLLTMNFASSLFYIFRWENSSSQGYLIFTVQNSFIMLVLIATVTFQNIKEMVKDNIDSKKAIKLHLNTMSLLTIIAILFLIVSMLSSPKIANAISWENKEQTTFFKTDEKYIGAYDPTGNLKPIQIKHYFIDWKDIGNVNQSIIGSRMKGYIPMITLEPWPELENENVLEKINQGEYDNLAKKLASVIANHKPQNIIIRFGHEMELAEIYPWSQPDPYLYIKAYRKIVDIFRKNGADNAIWVWSPAGEYRAALYYPGDEYVDIVGVTILSDPNWNNSVIGKTDPTFKDYFQKRSWVKNYFGKPIIVAEYGLSGNNQAKKEVWIRESKEKLSEDSLLIALIYFNALNLHKIDNNMPSWSISEDIWQEVWK